MSDVTRLLTQVESGDPQAAEQLLPLVYDELRKLAVAKLAHEKPGHTLNATALVHEAYLRLGEPVVRVPQPLPAGGGRVRCGASWSITPAAGMPTSVAAAASGFHWTNLCAGPNRRTTFWPWKRPSAGSPLEEPRKAELVVLRFFAGMTIPEAALALGVSVPTAERWWAFARTWLYADLAEGNSENP